MGSRLELQTLLESLIGSSNVYFQPPPNLNMAYPCIVYKISDADTKFAGNVPYRYTKRYMITIMDSDSDSQIPDKIAMLPTCIFDRSYVANNLYHTVFLLHF